MIWVNFGANEKQQRVWTLTEKSQMDYGRRKTKDGATTEIEEWEKYRGTLFCTTIVHSREGSVVPENPPVSTRDSCHWRNDTALLGNQYIIRFRQFPTNIGWPSPHVIQALLEAPNHPLHFIHPVN